MRTSVGLDGQRLDAGLVGIDLADNGEARQGPHRAGLRPLPPGLTNFTILY
jgi:hypothetical protein